MININPISSGSKGNCYVVDDGLTMLLLDCGISIKQIEVGTGFRPHKIAGVLVTHEHGDHAKSVDKFIKMGTHVYGPAEIFKSAPVINTLTYATPIIDGSKFVVGTWIVTAFACQHDVPCLGYYLHSTHTGENLVYFTDTYYIRYTFPDLHYIMAECNNSTDIISKNVESGKVSQGLANRLYQSHMDIDTLEQLLDANDLSKVKRIYLLHLSDNNSDEAEFKRRIQEKAGCEVYVC